MQIKRILLFFGSGWEILRFVLVFFMMLSLSGYTLTSSRVIMIMWVGSVQFVLAAGFLLTALYPDSRGGYIKLLAFGKLLNIFPAVIILIFESGLFAWGASRLLFAAEENGYIEAIARNSEIKGLFPLILIITLLDLIFFIFLISYSSGRKSGRMEKSGENKDHLPVADEVTVEEE